jgi:hypothetical protein
VAAVQVSVVGALMLANDADERSASSTCSTCGMPRALQADCMVADDVNDSVMACTSRL